MGPYLSIAEKIFDDGDVMYDGNILKYHKSEEYLPDRYFYLLIKPDEKDLIKYSADHTYSLATYFNKLHQIGPYESLILSKMLFSPEKYITIIFGAMGSGKSTLLRFVTEFFKQNLKKEYKKNTLAPLYIDLNYVGDIRNYSSEQTYFDEIFNRISEKIETTLTIKYPHKEFYSFWQKCIKITIKRETFSWIYNINNVVSDMQVGNALRVVRDYVDHFSPEKRFRFWSLLLSIESVLNESEVDTFIILDNIDQHASLLQNRLLSHLNSICQETKRIRVLISMRVVTFENTWRDIKKDLITNCSILPEQILKLRIRDFILDTIKDYPRGFSQLRDYQKATLVVVLLELYYLIQDRNSKLLKTISAISGFSIRRALSLAGYLFRQENSPFDRISKISFFIENNNLTENILSDIKTLDSDSFGSIASRYFYLINDMKNEKSEHKHLIHYLKDTFYCNLLYFRSFHEIIEEKLLENIFFKANQKFSLVKIRILFFLRHNKVTTIKELYSHINNFSNHVDDFLYAINSLASQHRRLIFFDGPTEFKDSNMLNTHIDKRIILTTAGTGYVDFLSKNYEYIQFCLLERGEYFGSHNGVEKLKILIENVFSLIVLDIAETKEFRETFKTQAAFFKQCSELFSFSVLKSFIERSILHSFGKLLRRRTSGAGTTIALKEIYLNLESNFNIVENEMSSLFGSAPKEFLELVNKFKELKPKFFPPL